MTRKDYIQFAKMFKEFGQELYGKGVSEQWNWFVSDFADLLKADNPNFDRKRFMEALAEND